ncbi:IspD/TarI family cytidylyltransferase [Methanomethylophilus alvi]|uniref:2-C-methyl-D-erythritol 4-phosphate cytidylyltransferase n=1 Tax=Methanomethylophilus alvi TaxID=1291540 RepID=A0A3G3IEN0_9ARCH|nr:IspD/TarI family cytidylyltransferase [Methanomethylophilus alvi]AYQ54280.1 2-C-methyl-D-erythritol 4-phosphate cytidylyltransferase [Methanomethylophilus alvi]
MKTVALILAGGIGKRMGVSLPKQFLEIKGKPVLVHTLSNFQRNDSVNSIVVVCVSDWIEYTWDLVKKYNLSKVEAIIPGGDTSHDSTRNGIFHLRRTLGKGDVVIIHDAARPILPQKAIDEMLRIAKDNGNASLAIPCYETVIYTDDQLSGNKELDRSHLMRVQTPQAYEYSSILELYERAEKEDRHDFIYADIVAVEYGMTVYFSKGFTNNIKITKQEDIPLCEYLMDIPEDQLFDL